MFDKWCNHMACCFNIIINCIFIDKFIPNTNKGCFSCHVGFVSCTTAPLLHLLAFCSGTLDTIYFIIAVWSWRLHWRYPKLPSFIHIHYIKHGNRSEYATTEKKGLTSYILPQRAHNTSKQNWLQPRDITAKNCPR